MHQSLCAAVGPLLDRHLIGDTCACGRALGTHAAARRATVWARQYRYFVHLDVTKYFATIDQAILLSQLERDVPCKRIFKLCRMIVEAGAKTPAGPRRHFPGDDLFAPASRRVGLPIGNLTSQYFANRYLSPVDHRAKDHLGIRAYLRYMDDMLLFGDDRVKLTSLARAVEEACWQQRLRLHPWQAQPTRAGVTFVVYRILPDHVRVRRTSVARAERRLAALAENVRAGRVPPEVLLRSLQATFAHWSHADTFKLRVRTLRRLGLWDLDPSEVETAPLEQPDP